MFKITEIRELIRLLDETSISELHVESAGTKLSIKKPEPHVIYSTSPLNQNVALPQNNTFEKPPVQQVEPSVSVRHIAPPESAAAVSFGGAASTSAEEDTSLVKIISPMVGTFYSAPSPDTPAYVGVGDKVTEKSVVCIVEAMKLMNEIEADVSGEIMAVLVENGQLVEYGQAMFLVKPE